MDVERCVALHNQILLYGWTHSGHSADTFEAQCRTWYDSDATAAKAVQKHIRPPLFEFLRQARQPVDCFFSFFYYVRGLVGAESLFMDFETWQYDVDEGEEKRYVTLYMVNQLASHPLGLIFDQESNLCILMMSIWDMEEGHFTNKSLWRPLESVLESWLSMIENARMVAMPKQHYARQADSPPTQYPWIQVPYSDIILNETVEAFNRLVLAIEDRLPNVAAAVAEERPRMGLVGEHVLEAMRLPDGFVKSLLLRARRPRFRFIAPGLSIPSSASFDRQPFWSHLDHEHPRNELPPLLLFDTSHAYTTPKPVTDPQPTGRLATLWSYANSIAGALKTGYHIYSHSPTVFKAVKGIRNHYNRTVEIAKHDPECPFGPPFSKTHEYNAGLYLSALGNVDDEIAFLLPLDVRDGGFARTSDGASARMERDVYGLSFTPFRGWAKPTLLDVLRHWVGMVESGAWSIDEQGVAGGIEMWREADGEETWERYTLPMGE